MGSEKNNEKCKYQWKAYFTILEMVCSQKEYKHLYLVEKNISIFREK